MDFKEFSEALNTAQRMKASRNAKKNKSKLKKGREKAERKTADKATVDNRSVKRARSMLFKKLSNGKSKEQMSPSEKQRIEKRLDSMGSKIKTLAKRLVKDVKKDERDRKVNKKD